MSKEVNGRAREEVREEKVKKGEKEKERKQKGIKTKRKRGGKIRDIR